MAERDHQPGVQRHSVPGIHLPIQRINEVPRDGVRSSLNSVSVALVQPPSESLPAHIDEGSPIQSATGHEFNLRGTSRLGVIYGVRRPHNTYGQEF